MIKITTGKYTFGFVNQGSNECKKCNDLINDCSFCVN